MTVSKLSKIIFNSSLIKSLSIAFIMIFSIITSTYACTYFFLKSIDDSVIVGRSVEYGGINGWNLDLAPRGTVFDSKAPQGLKPVTWKSKYGFVGITHNGRPYFVDGMNEKGLNVAAQWFIDKTYPTLDDNDNALRNDEVVAWMLSNFSSVNEVKKALSTVKIYGAFNKLANKIFPLHWAVTDSSGNSIVIEHINGEIKIMNNITNGVMTNAPNLEFQLTNLRLYSNLNPANKASMEPIKDVVPMVTGLMGLPGTFTSPSRFVRISVQKYYAPKPVDAYGAVNQAFHLLNTVDYVPGVVVFDGDRGENNDGGQLTAVVTISDLKNKLYYYRTTDDLSIRQINLNEIDFSKGKPYKSMKIFGKNWYINDTLRLTKDVQPKIEE
jgi:choloylglycine hydrolase